MSCTILYLLLTPSETKLSGVGQEGVGCVGKKGDAIPSCLVSEIQPNALDVLLMGPPAKQSFEVAWRRWPAWDPECVFGSSLFERRPMRAPSWLECGPTHLAPHDTNVERRKHGGPLLRVLRACPCQWTEWRRKFPPLLTFESFQAHWCYHTYQRNYAAHPAI